MAERGEDIILDYLQNMIGIASTEESPDEVIAELLQYLGTKLGADRTYIFEENKEGSFDNTYEWCREGVSAEINNLQGVPYEAVAVWFDEFKAHSYMIIPDIEEYRAVSPVCYEILEPQGIHSLVAAPVKNGDRRAFFGVDNPPKENIRRIAILIKETVCLFDMILRMRENTKVIAELAMSDVMTGCRNRAALMRDYEDMSAKEDSLCVMMCDLNGLKEKNDKEGHKAGDKYVCSFAQILMEFFDKTDCYRIGGDEFLAVQSNVSEAEIEEKKRMLLAQCEKFHVSVSIGISFRTQEDTIFSQIMHRADTKMYEEKKKYYESIGKDRRMTRSPL